MGLSCLWTRTHARAASRAASCSSVLLCSINCARMVLVRKGKAWLCDIYFRVLELVHGGVARFSLDNTKAPSVNHPRHSTITGNVLAVVPGVPFLVNAVGDGHAPNLERRCHAAL